MLCPHCGPHGHLEQTAFSSEFEHYFCTVCGVKYVVYPLGNGEYTEPVPVAPRRTPQKTAIQNHPQDETTHF